MSLRAYQQAASRAEAPKDAEYRLFGQVTRALIVASEAPATDFAVRARNLDDALVVILVFELNACQGVIDFDVVEPVLRHECSAQMRVINCQDFALRHLAIIVLSDQHLSVSTECNHIPPDGLRPDIREPDNRSRDRL